MDMFETDAREQNCFQIDRVFILFPREFGVKIIHINKILCTHE